MESNQEIPMDYLRELAQSILEEGTSPSILHDITLDRSEMDAKFGAATGLTMKEYDEQLKKLTAENFQLKLKIYFMDSRLSKMEGIKDKDLVKENVDLKVTNDTQAKKLESKQKLLYEACEAFEQLQREHQETLTRLTAQHNKEKGELQIRLDALEASVRLSSRQASDKEFSALRCEIGTLEEKLQAATLRIKELECDLDKKTLQEESSKLIIRETENTVESYKCKVEESLKKKDEENERLREEISCLRSRLHGESDAENELWQGTRDASFIKELEELKSKLCSKEAELAKLEGEHRKACSTIKMFVKKVQTERAEKEHLAEELRNKEEMIEELTKHLNSRNRNPDESQANRSDQLPSNCLRAEGAMARLHALEAEVVELNRKQDAGHFGEELSKELAAKTCEIDRLNVDLKRTTSHLQELVNKELWDKNRQIEKLEKRLSDTMKNSEDVLELKIRLDELTNEKGELTEEINRLRAREEPLKEACKELTCRLEELAGFLDSLLTDRVVMYLDNEQQEKMKRAVVNSLEYSRTLSQSLVDNTLGDSLVSDQSIVISKLREQLSVLSQQVLQRDIELSYCHKEFGFETSSKGGSDSDVLFIPQEIDDTWLRQELCDVSQERKPLNCSGAKKKIDRFGIRSTLATAVSGVRGLECDASESEAWSEPDRSVSLARMGRIDPSSVTPLRLSKCMDTSESEETLNESRIGKRTRSVDSDTKKLKIKLLEEANKTLKEQVSLLEEKHTILNKLSGTGSGPALLEEIQQSLTELEESRETCKRLKTDFDAMKDEMSRVKSDLAKKEEKCREQQQCISELEARVEEITFDYELRLIEATGLKEMAASKVSEFEQKLIVTEKERNEIEARLVEFEKKVEDTQRLKKESSAHVLEATKHLDTAEKMLLDAEKEKEESNRKVRELQQYVECLRHQMDEKTKEVEAWAKKASKEAEETSELRRRLQEAERSKMAVELKVKEAKERIQWMESKLRELEMAMDQCDLEAQIRMSEEVQRGVDAKMTEIKKDWVSRVDYENVTRKMENLEEKFHFLETQKRVLQEGFKEREEDLFKKISRIESENIDLCRHLDNLKVMASEAEMELARLTNEKLLLEENLRKAIEKQNGLLRNQQDAEERFLSTIRNLEKQSEDEVSIGGAHGSVAHELLWIRNLNTSPDLGIESDQGRFSSLEHQDQRAILPRLNCDVNANQLEAENLELKKRLAKMGHTLDETLSQLAAANHHKKQMERAICKQLHKTHHILKKARINFEAQDSDSVDG